MSDDLETLKAKAAKWREAEAHGTTPAQLDAQAARYRKLKAATVNYTATVSIWVDDHTELDYAGDALDAAVDALGEKMDKEAR